MLFITQKSDQVLVSTVDCSYKITSVRIYDFEIGFEC